MKLKRVRQRTVLVAVVVPVLVAWMVVLATGGALAGTVDLKVWLSAPEEKESKVWAEIAKAFEAKNPGIKVDLTTKIEAGRPFFQKLQTAIAAKDAPDVTWLGARPFILTFGSSGILSPLTGYVDQGRFVKGSLMHSIWESDKVRPELTGQLVAVPAQLLGAPLPAYNKKLFERLGLKPPATWEEDMQNRAKMKAAGKIPSLYAGRVATQAVITLRGIMYAVAGGTAEPLWDMLLYWTRSFDDPRFLRALALFREVSQYWQRGWESATPQDLDLLWGTGNVGVHEAWTTDLVQWPARYPGIEFGVYLHPTIGGVPSMYPGGPTFHVGVPVMAKHKDEAAKFINYITSPEVSTKLATELLTLPVISKARESAEFKGLVKKYPLFAAFLESDERFSKYPGGEPPLEVSLPDRQGMLVLLNNLLVKHARGEVTAASLVAELEASKKAAQKK